MGNLGNDLAPSNIFSDTASSFQSQPGWAQGLEIGGAALLGGLALPELLPAAGSALDLSGGAAAGGLGGFDLGTIGPGVAAAGGDLSGLTAADVTYLDPTLLGEASVGPFDTGTAAVPFTGANMAGQVAGGTPGAGVLDFSPSSIQATGGDVIPGAGGGGAAFADPSAGADVAGTGTSPDLGYAVYSNGQPVGIQGAAPFAQPAAPGGTDVLSQIGTFMGSPAGKGATTLLGVGGLGANLYSGYQQNQALNAAAQQQKVYAQEAQNAQAAALKIAQPLINSGEMLTSYLTSNTLPPQFQSQVDQWVKSTKAGIIQGYTSRGQSGNPEQNSALQQDLANVDQQALGLQGQFEEILSSAGQQMITTANSLLSTGLSATQLSSEIPLAVSKLNLALNAQMTSAISNFAAALNGGNRNLGGGGSLNISLNPQTGALA